MAINRNVIECHVFRAEISNDDESIRLDKYVMVKVPPRYQTDDQQLWLQALTIIFLWANPDTPFMLEKLEYIGVGLTVEENDGK